MAAGAPPLEAWLLAASTAGWAGQAGFGPKARAIPSGALATESPSQVTPRPFRGGRAKAAAARRAS